eukprot:207757-Chlamydomonas_euryale.AAC.1
MHAASAGRRRRRWRQHGLRHGWLPAQHCGGNVAARGGRCRGQDAGADRGTDGGKGADDVTASTPLCPHCPCFLPAHTSVLPPPIFPSSPLPLPA